MENEADKKPVGRPRGHPKSGGRKKGTPNKATRAARVIIADFIKRNSRTLQNDYEAIADPKDRLMIFERLLRYVVPTQSAAKVDISQLSEDDISALAASMLNSMKDDC